MFFNFEWEIANNIQILVQIKSTQKLYLYILSNTVKVITCNDLLDFRAYNVCGL